MIGAFETTETGWTCQIDEYTRRVVLQLVEEIISLLDAPIIQPAWFHAIDPEENHGREAPESNVLEKLLPRMSADDAEAAALRELTEDDLRQDKTTRLEKIFDQLSSPTAIKEGLIFIPRGQEWEWLAGINDLRLALAASLGLEDEADARQVLHVVEALTEDETGSAWPANTPDLHTDQSCPPVIEGCDSEAILPGEYVAGCGDIGLTEVAPAEQKLPDPFVCVLYTLLSWWQESLLDEMETVPFEQ